MRFAYPWLAILFLGAPLIAFLQWYLWDYRRRVTEKIGVGGRKRSQPIYIAKSCAWVLAWICLVLAWMGPQGNPKYVGGGGKEEVKVARQKPQDVIFLIDASASMSVPDGKSKATRLEDAKELAELMIQQLKGQNVALYAFTSEATPLSPPTPDYLFTTLTLRGMKINEGEAAGTDLSVALDTVLKQYGNDNPQKQHTLVIMSDGGDNNLDDPKGGIPKVLKKVQDLSNKGWNFVVFGVGSLQGGIVPGVEDKGKKVFSKLDERLLKKIAEVSKGNYYRASEGNRLDLTHRASREILSEVKRKGKEDHTSPQQVVYDNYFQIPLTLALLLLLFIFLYPDTQKEEG